MTTDAGDAGLSYRQALERVNEPMTAQELAEERELSDWAMNQSGRRPMRDWIDRARLLVTLDAQSAQLAAYQSTAGVLVRQGLVFVNREGWPECIACGQIYKGEGAAIRHMPDCAAEALRALVAGEGDGS